MASASPRRRVPAWWVAVVGLCWVAPARADHTSYEPGGALGAWIQEYGFPSEPSYRPRSERRCDRRCECVEDGDCTSSCEPCSGHHHGTPWSVLRRHLAATETGPAWHDHPECWFVRRWPVPKDASIAGHRCEDLECSADACVLCGAALAEAVTPATNEERLLRGLERFHLGRTEDAAADFRAVAEADPKEARALYATAVCAFASNRWPDGAKALRSLSDLGALDATDRWDTADVFPDPSKVRSLVTGLESYAQWAFHDADAQLVLGWALVSTGRADDARAHLKSVLRFKPEDPAAKRLIAGLDAAPPPPK